MKVNKQVVVVSVFAFVLFAGVANIFAQTTPTPTQERQPVRIERDVMIVRDGPVAPEAGVAVTLPVEAGMIGGDNTFVFLSSEMSFDGRVVRGAPYSAEAVTEMTRTLNDGNRIVHRTTASVYRDGEGRTRRDQTLGTIGPFAAAGEPHQTSFINDPVAGINYILDPRTSTARRLPLPRIAVRTNPPGEGQARANSPHRVEAEPPIHGIRIRTPHRNQQATTESLGRQTIGGVEADGTRSTVTIPEGEMGNERPIQIVSESWYSPELQTVVMTRRNDPLTGEVVYRLTNINRSEPARSLFEVPANYTIRDLRQPPAPRQ